MRRENEHRGAANERVKLNKERLGSLGESESLRRLHKTVGSEPRDSESAWHGRGHMGGSCPSARRAAGGFECPSA